MRNSLLLLLGLLLFSMQSFSNILPENTKQNLIKNGVRIINEEKTYTDHQYFLLQSFDFTAFRNYTTKRTVQIEDGPLIELYSLTEIQQQGVQIPQEFLENKKDEIIDTNLQKVITLINIGFKYGPKLNTETGF